MHTENKEVGRPGGEYDKWAEENSAELDKPLTNRGFLLGCSVLAEAMLFASPRGDDNDYNMEEWKRTLSLLKDVFIEDWRGDA